MNTDQLLRMGHLCQIVFAVHGLDVDEIHDISAFEKRMVAIGKKPSRKPFDPRSQDLGSHRISAILLKNKGRDIGGVAGRLYDLGERSLAECLDVEARDRYGADRPPGCVSNTAKVMRGNVAYCGEMHIKETVAGKSWRGRPALSAALVRYIQTHCFVRWNCDWVYGIIKPEEAEKKGRAIQYGFVRQVKGFQIWPHPNQDGRETEEYLVANDRGDFADIIDACTRAPDTNFPGFSELKKLHR